MSLDLLKKKGKIKIDNIFTNKKNGQLSVVLSKKKLRGRTPKKVELVYWY